MLHNRTLMHIHSEEGFVLECRWSINVMNLSIFLVLTVTVKLCNAKTWSLQNSFSHTASEFLILFVNGQSEHYDARVCLWKHFSVFIVEKLNDRTLWEAQGRHCWRSRGKLQHHFQCQGAAFSFYKDTSKGNCCLYGRNINASRKASSNVQLCILMKLMLKFRSRILSLNSSVDNLPNSCVRLFSSGGVTYQAYHTYISATVIAQRDTKDRQSKQVFCLQWFQYINEQVLKDFRVSPKLVNVMAVAVPL